MTLAIPQEHFLELPYFRINIFFPSLNIIKFGIPRTPYFDGTSGESSILNLTNFILPLYFSDNSSKIGNSNLQGPHHSAQKSITTGISDFKTSFSKFESLEL